jgi:MFS family permease
MNDAGPLVPVPQRLGTFLVAFLIMIANNGFPLGGLTIFDADMLKETGASIGGLRLRDTITVVVLGLSVPFAGYVLDRFAVKPVIVTGLALMAAALLLYPYVHDLGQVYGVHVLLGLSEATCGVVSCVYLVSNLTGRFRGPALATLIAGSSLGNAVVPKFNAWLLGFLPWREAVSAGGWIAVLLIPLVLILVREPAVPRGMGDSRIVEGPDLRTALRSRNFQLLALIAGLTVFSVLVLATNVALAFPGEGPTLLFALFGAAVIGQLLAGLAAYRWPAGRVHAMLLTLLVAGAVEVALGPSAWRTTGVAVFGFGWGANSAMLQVRPTLFFSGPALGRTLAVLAVCETLGGGLGPTVAGYLRDTAGNYSLAFALTVAFTSLAFLLSLGFSSVRPPRGAPSRGS